MKFSCLPVSFYQDLSAGKMSLLDWFNTAAELGLDGADVSIAHLEQTSDSDLSTLREQAEAAGVQIAMLVTYADFSHPDTGERVRQREALLKHIDMATHLGASFIRVTAGQAHPETGRAEGIEWVVAGLTSCLEQAAAAGITLVTENHTIGYGWTEFDFTQPADIFLEVMARTEGTDLKLLFDTGNNLVLNDDPLAVLEAVKHRVAVVHVSDMREAGVFEPVVIGTGAAPIEGVFQALHAIGFDGWISTEEASKTGEAGFRQAIPYVRQLWERVAG